MDVFPPITLPAPQWRWRVLLWAALAVAFTSWSIQYSFQHGRLIGVAGFDDVSYFNDGADRLDVYYARGWNGLIRSYVEAPPHSPYSTTLAAVSFGLFGVHDWAPYAGNGLIIFALIAFTEWLLLGARPWLRIVGLGLVLTLPLTLHAVCEFRPDATVAILTAMGVVMAVTRSLVASSFRYRFLVGLVFGLALWVKPTICVLTLFLWGLSLGTALLCDWYVHRPTYRKLLTTYVLTGLITIAVASPYYVYNGQNVAIYIYRSIFGSHAEMWQAQMTRSEQFLFFLTGPGAVEMLDNSVWMLGAAILIGLVHLIARRQTETLVRSAALAFCMLGAYTVPTLSPCKHGFYGMAFFSLVLFAALLALREIYLKAPGRPIGRWAATLALAVSAVVAFWQEPHISNSGTRGDSRVGSSRKTCNDIVSALVAQNLDDNAIVITTAESHYPSSHTLKWTARQHGRKFNFEGTSLTTVLEKYRPAMDGADCIVAMELANPRPLYPNERMARETLALARSMPYLIEVGSFPSYDGTVYYLFRNTQPPFSGWTKVESLGPIEGPFPKWELPRVRWGYGKSTQFWFESKNGTPLRLSMKCRTALQDQTLTVLLDGKEIGTQTLPAQVKFATIDFPLPATTPGEHELTLQYSATEASADPRSLSVLFERLQIRPASDQ